jgi:hypothetical protein
MSIASMISLTENRLCYRVLQIWRPGARGYMSVEVNIPLTMAASAEWSGRVRRVLAIGFPLCSNERMQWHLG